MMSVMPCYLTRLISNLFCLTDNYDITVGTMTIDIARGTVLIENVTGTGNEKHVMLNVSVKGTDVKNAVNPLTELRDINGEYR